MFQLNSWIPLRGISSGGDRSRRLPAKRSTKQRRARRSPCSFLLLGRLPSGLRSHRIFQRYTTGLPTSLSCIASVKHKRHAVETCCGVSVRSSFNSRMRGTGPRTRATFIGDCEGHRSLHFFLDHTHTEYVPNETAMASRVPPSVPLLAAKGTRTRTRFLKARMKIPAAEQRWRRSSPSAHQSPTQRGSARVSTPLSLRIRKRPFHHTRNSPLQPPDRPLTLFRFCVTRHQIKHERQQSRGPTITGHSSIGCTRVTARTQRFLPHVQDLGTIAQVSPPSIPKTSCGDLFATPMTPPYQRKWGERGQREDTRLIAHRAPRPPRPPRFTTTLCQPWKWICPFAYDRSTRVQLVLARKPAPPQISNTVRSRSFPIE